LGHSKNYVWEINGLRLLKQMKGVMPVVPKNKMSKKAQAELNKQKRVTWDFSPVSRVKQNGKIYNRKRRTYDSY